MLRSTRDEAGRLQRPSAWVRPGALAALGAGAAVLAAWGPLRSLDRPVSDLNLAVVRRIRTPARPPIVCVLIGENALRRVSSGSLRDLLARLLDRINQHHPLGVAVDVLLRDPADPAQSRHLASALGATRSVVAAALDDGGSPRWLLPEPLFQEISQIGHAVIEPDEDGIFRRMSAFKQNAGLSIPALPLVAARFVSPGLRFATGSAIRPDFAIGPSDIPVLSARELLEDDSEDRGRVIDGRIVFVGIGAPAASDRVYLPTRRGEPPVPGVLALAAVTAALLNGGCVKELPPMAVGLTVLAAAAGVHQWRRQRGSPRLLHLLAAALAIECLSVATLWAAGLVLPTLTLILAVGACSLAEQIAESSAVARQTERLSAELATQVIGAESAVLPTDALGRLEVLRGLQDRVREDRDRRRVLLENLDEGVLLWNRDGLILTANAAAGRLLGIDLAAGVGTGIPDLFRTDAAVGSGGAGKVKIGGRDLELEQRAVGDGIVLGLVRDVTALQELERRRRDTQQLITHELRTPLTSLAGFGQMLERYEFDRNEGRHVGHLIRVEAERLGRMVATLLDLETLAAGGGGAKTGGLDLFDVVRARCEVLHAAAVSRSQTLHIEREGGCSIPVRGDADLLGRVVDNLVGNAIKYAPDGSEIGIRLRAADGRAVLEVADQGPGIPPEELPRIFERFYRGPTANGGGSGLGLALVKETVEWHGGSVDVESGRGRGTTFRILLPLDPQGAGVAP